MQPDPGALGEAAAPARRDIIGVVPQARRRQLPRRLALDGDAGDADGAAPGFRRPVGMRHAAAMDEGELGALDDDAAQAGRKTARGGAVHHHFGDRELALERLAARFEIDRVGEAFLLGVAGSGGGLGPDLDRDPPRDRRLRGGAHPGGAGLRPELQKDSFLYRGLKHRRRPASTSGRRT